MYLHRRYNRLVGSPFFPRAVDADNGVPGTLAPAAHGIPGSGGGKAHAIRLCGCRVSSHPSEVWRLLPTEYGLIVVDCSDVTSPAVRYFRAFAAPCLVMLSPATDVNCLVRVLEMCLLYTSPSP